MNRTAALALTVCVAPACSILAQSPEEPPRPPTSEAATAPTPAPAESEGLLPIPDYTGDLMHRSHLLGDWGGRRTMLASKGIRFDLDWNQYVQGIASGGRDNVTRYGGNGDYLVNFDLMRMGVLPGAVVQFRAESRYGNSVNGLTGSILPVNTDAFFPLTDDPDRGIPFTITNLLYTQFLSEKFAIYLGKLDTLDGDPNEFASGRGTTQFMNANLVFNPALALRLPYSTLGAGLLWQPSPHVSVTTSIINTADSSTTTGFEDFGDGLSWSAEAGFQYRLGDLPGGQNVGVLYSFDQDFARVNARLIFQPGEGLSLPTTDETWAVYWSAWQYLWVMDPGDQPINLTDGAPDHQGFGLFARAGIADEDTNPIEWAVSAGLGARGLIPSRENDTAGVGYFYTRIQTNRITGILGIDDAAQGFEAFYNIALTPAAHLTLDAQVVDSATPNIDTAVVLGVRLGLSF